jgi:GTP cyclohydrolase III
MHVKTYSEDNSYPKYKTYDEMVTLLDNIERKKMYQVFTRMMNYVQTRVELCLEIWKR